MSDGRGWRWVRLGDVARIETTTVKPDQSTHGSLPYISVENIAPNEGRLVSVQSVASYQPTSGSHLFSAGQILYSRIRPALNKVVMVDFAGLSSTEIYPFSIINPDQLTAAYLTYLLRSPQFVRYAVTNIKGSHIPRISTSDIYNYEIPLPPLPEQQRIADLLAEADAARRLQAEANAKLGELLPSLFAAMFGDPRSNPLGWPTSKLGVISTIVGGGTPDTKEPDYWGGDVVWATPADLSKLTSLTLTSTQRTLSEAGYNSRRLPKLPIGTVLLTSRAPIGYSAVAGVEMCTSQDFKNLIPKPDVRSMYVLFALRSQMDYLKSFGRGMTIQGVNTEAVANLNIMLPPLELQQQFERVCAEVEGLREHGETKLAELTDLFNSLLTRLFTPPPSAVPAATIKVKITQADVDRWERTMGVSNLWQQVDVASNRWKNIFDPSIAAEDTATMLRSVGASYMAEGSAVDILRSVGVNLSSIIEGPSAAMAQTLDAIRLNSILGWEVWNNTASSIAKIGMNSVWDTLPKIDFASIMPKIDFASIMPKIDFASIMPRIAESWRVQYPPVLGKDTPIRDRMVGQLSLWDAAQSYANEPFNLSAISEAVAAPGQSGNQPVVRSQLALLIALGVVTADRLEDGEYWSSYTRYQQAEFEAEAEDEPEVAA